MVRSITKDTVLCMSLAGRPSNVGTRFHNFLYAELDLDFVYKAFTTTDLAAAVAGIRALGIRGCGVPMPYKEACIQHVDALDGSAETILDVVALPALTPLVRRARAQGKQVITGAEVIALQAVEQFVLYAGVRPSDDQVRRASEFSRA
jgi:shikimate 5-dehydrogenase